MAAAWLFTDHRPGRVAAILSLSIGLYPSAGQPTPQGGPSGDTAFAVTHSPSDLYDLMIRLLAGGCGSATPLHAPNLKLPPGVP